MNSKHHHSRHHIERAVLLVVLLNIAAMIAATTTWGKQYGAAFGTLDLLFLVVFCVEYIWRLSTAAHVSKQFIGISGKFKFALTPLMLLDLAAIVPAFFLWGDATALRSLRLLAIFRVFKILRYQNAAERLLRSIQSKLPELVIVLIVLCVFMLISAVAMYGAEHDAQPAVFSSILDGIWWSIITATTIGYGDIVPITGFGKIIASLCAFIGILLIALPTSLIAAGFMEQIQTQEIKGQKK